MKDYLLCLTLDLTVWLWPVQSMMTQMTDTMMDALEQWKKNDTNKCRCSSYCDSTDIHLNGNKSRICSLLTHSYSFWI